MAGLLGLYLLSSGITSFVVLTGGLLFRESAIELGESLKRIDAGWSITEKQAFNKWRSSTRRLLLTSGQRTLVSYVVAISIAGGGLVLISSLTLSGTGLLWGMGTLALGAISGLALAIAGVAYIRDADPSSRQDWKKSDAYDDYVKNLNQDDEFEASLKIDVRNGSISAEEAKEMQERWYRGR
jgi:hypothetical protein